MVLVGCGPGVLLLPGSRPREQPRLGHVVLLEEEKDRENG